MDLEYEHPNYTKIIFLDSDDTLQKMWRRFPLLKPKLHSWTHTSRLRLQLVPKLLINNLCWLTAVMEAFIKRLLLMEDTKPVITSAQELMGNRPAHISRGQVPPAPDAKAAPHLLGPDFTKRSKEHLDQVKALCTLAS